MRSSMRLFSWQKTKLGSLSGISGLYFITSHSIERYGIHQGIIRLLWRLDKATMCHVVNEAGLTPEILQEKRFVLI